MRHTWTEEELGYADAIWMDKHSWIDVANDVSVMFGVRVTAASARNAVAGWRKKRDTAGDDNIGVAPNKHDKTYVIKESEIDVDMGDLLTDDETKPIITKPPSAALHISDLVEFRKRQFAAKGRHEVARELIPVVLRETLPIGLMHFGDPHLDDDGTDIGLVEAHGKLVRETPGLYGCNVGDTTNNWPGRMARLYGEQGTSAKQAWALAEWFIRDLVGPKWMYIVGGNHDLWSGAGDPLQWITRCVNAMYQDSDARIALRFPNGREVRINCRHDFPGSSIYNPAHGPMRALQFGRRDHVAIAGHLHISAHGVLKCPESGITMHALRVASYKKYDAYARERGFQDRSISPCALSVIDPRLGPTHPDLVKVFWDPMEGAKYLTWARGG